MNDGEPGQLSVAQRPDSGSDRCHPGSFCSRLGEGQGKPGSYCGPVPCALAILGTLLATTFSRVAFEGNEASQSWDRGWAED